MRRREIAAAAAAAVDFGYNAINLVLFEHFEFHLNTRRRITGSNFVRVYVVRLFVRICAGYVFRGSLSVNTCYLGVVSIRSITKRSGVLLIYYLKTRKNATSKLKSSQSGRF